MCCFKPNPASVSGTRIFASRVRPGRQVIVYSMTVGLSESLAMILPVPVRRNAADDAVKFFSMKRYPQFFDDLDALFLPPDRKPAKGGFGGGGGSGGSGAPLEIHEVGDFEASFVPSLADFNRLDERFRIEESVWLTQPDYARYGFVVFQLRVPQTSRPDPGVVLSKPHPMAFEFPLYRPDLPLFFPTVHVHDGTMPENAEFDHTLHAQTETPDGRRILAWDESGMLIIGKVDRRKAGRLILENRHCYRRLVTGSHPNRDIWL